MLRKQDPSLTAAGLTKLEIVVDESLEMPMVWIAAQALLCMWKIRCTAIVVSMLTTRSVLQSKINLLRETRYSNEHQLIGPSRVRALPLAAGTNKGGHYF